MIFLLLARPHGCGCHEVLSFKIRVKHHNFYRNPDADDGIYDCLLTCIAATGANNIEASFLFVGDFIAHHMKLSMWNTNCRGLKAFISSLESKCDKVIHKPTHRSGNT